MYKKFILATLLGLMGCASTAPTKIPGTTITHVATTPNDTDWIVVAKDNWSFKLPPGYQDAKQPGQEMDVLYRSPHNNILISFTTDNTNANLQDYTSSLGNEFFNIGGQLITARHGTLDNRDASLLVISIPPNVITFNVVSVFNSKAYIYSCVVSSYTSEREASVCGLISKTIKIK